ncbi:MAG: hypothetical protein WCB46_00405 [Methanoregula sp.]
MWMKVPELCGNNEEVKQAFREFSQPLQASCRRSCPARQKRRQPLRRSRDPGHEQPPAFLAKPGCSTGRTRPDMAKSW